MATVLKFPQYFSHEPIRWDKCDRESAEEVRIDPVELPRRCAEELFSLPNQLICGGYHFRYYHNSYWYQVYLNPRKVCISLRNRPPARLKADHEQLFERLSSSIIYPCLLYYCIMF